MALVNDPNFTGLAKELYAHASESVPLGPGCRRSALKNAPAYVDQRRSSREAMLDITGLSAATRAGRRAGAGGSGGRSRSKLKARMRHAQTSETAKPSTRRSRQLLQENGRRAVGGDVQAGKGRSCELVRQRDGSTERQIQAANTMDDFCHRALTAFVRQSGHHPGWNSSLGATCSGPEKLELASIKRRPSRRPSIRPSTITARGRQAIPLADRYRDDGLRLAFRWGWPRSVISISDISSSSTGFHQGSRLCRCLRIDLNFCAMRIDCLGWLVHHRCSRPLFGAPLTALRRCCSRSFASKAAGPSPDGDQRASRARPRAEATRAGVAGRTRSRIADRTAASRERA